VLPPRQIAVVFYGPTLLERHPEIGVRFMVAYLKAVRQYNQGKTERNLAILENWTGLDRSLLEACDWPHINRDGTILVESVRELRNWLFAEDYLDAMVPIDRMVDFHYARLAGEMLAGPKNTP